MVVTKGKRTVSLVLGSLFFATSMINSYAIPNINENVTNDISDVWSVHYTTQVIEKALEPTPSPTPEPTPSPTPTPTPLNQKAVETAKQYLGVPYVWGGTNLNTGADCSGFVKSVYKSFGYNLPRSSSSQRSAGRKVSYSNKQPGDLICYSGHIAIYIGNGKIVHASSRKTGIKISPKANYRKVLSVRRIVK